MDEVNVPVSGPDESMEQLVARLWGGDQMQVEVTFERFPLSDGTLSPPLKKLVTIRKARVRELSKTVGFFNQLLPKIDPQKLEDLIKMVGDLETANILKGDPAGKITLTPRQMIEKFGARSTLVLDALRGAVDMIPPAVEIYTNLTAEEADALELTDALLVMTGIIGANYDFFSHSLLPTLQAVIGGWRRKLNGSKQG